MKLEDLLGTELYEQVKAKIDEVNANEPDKLKHVRYADLSEGEYVGKGKFESEIEKLTSQISGKDTELEQANSLIAELKKASKGNEELQSKFSSYEEQNTQLQKELAETKLKAAVKVALMSEKAVDIDYLTFKLGEKLKEKGETLELDDNENIKGWDDKLSALKTQFPKMFETESAGEDGKYQILGDNRLPGGDERSTANAPKNLAEALKMQYTNEQNE